MGRLHRSILLKDNKAPLEIREVEVYMIIIYYIQRYPNILEYSLHSFISIVLAFGAMTKEQSKNTHFAFNYLRLSAHDESQAKNNQ